jgi:hypothetical protein
MLLLIRRLSPGWRVNASRVSIFDIWTLSTTRGKEHFVFLQCISYIAIVGFSVIVMWASPRIIRTFR